MFDIQSPLAGINPCLIQQHCRARRSGEYFQVILSCSLARSLGRDYANRSRNRPRVRKPISHTWHGGNGDGGRETAYSDGTIMVRWPRGGRRTQRAREGRLCLDPIAGSFKFHLILQYVLFSVPKYDRCRSLSLSCLASNAIHK